MQKYQSYNIANHPSISGESTRFLIANWGGKSGNNNLESKMDDIDAKVESVKRQHCKPKQQQVLQQTN